MKVETPDGHSLNVEVHGAEGAPWAVVLHGGPGGGMSRDRLGLFDLSRWRVVLLDQRGCGGSRPHAAEPAFDLSALSTQALVADLELVRAAVGADRWAMVGGSWGATLGLACVTRHPGVVTGVVLHAVTTTSAAEVAWLTEGLERFFPEDHAAFAAGAPARPGERTVDAYARLLADPDPAVHQPAADAWCAWDDRQMAGRRDAPPSAIFADPAFRLCFARQVAWFWSAHGFEAPGALLAGCAGLGAIPCAPVHGRMDLGCPPGVAWDVHRAWPGSVLEIVEGAGHRGLLEATARHVAALRDRL